MWEESLGTQAGVHLIEGVRLIRGPLNTGFTVFKRTLLVESLGPVTITVHVFTLLASLVGNIFRIPAFMRMKNRFDSSYCC